MERIPIIKGISRMAEKINITVRLDKEVKEQAERMFSGFGMDLSMAFNTFIHQAIRQGKIRTRCRRCAFLLPLSLPFRGNRVTVWIWKPFSSAKSKSFVEESK
jgi:hypothetical protein